MIYLRHAEPSRTLRHLVTGCSSGIGRATALALRTRGHEVVATARRVETLEELDRAGCHVLPLDVDDDDSITSAWSRAVDLVGQIDVLVNNAGYGLYGPIEELAISDARGQFETNFFGPMRLAQLALPGMRARGFGRIINVSSMGGRTTLPGGGYYHASKYALEAASDAMRIEVAPFGVDVVLVEPGPVRTPWSEVAVTNLLASGVPVEGRPYESMRSAVAAMMTNVYTGPVQWYASRPEHVAQAIVRAAEARRPRARYLVGPAAYFLVGLRRVLPDRLHDEVVRRGYHLARRKTPSFDDPADETSEAV
jgi:NAD(P)-dependent dehydrogenase (short-subunit alcohol dehydrogenase family)